MRATATNLTRLGETISLKPLSRKLLPTPMALQSVHTTSFLTVQMSVFSSDYAVFWQENASLITTIFPRIYARTYYAQGCARVISFSAREPDSMVPFPQPSARPSSLGCSVAWGTHTLVFIHLGRKTNYDLRYYTLQSNGWANSTMLQGLR
jgi:hypothetical protein